MTPEHILRERLRKIEVLFSGAATGGEKAAAGAAAERIRGASRQDRGKPDAALRLIVAGTRKPLEALRER